MRPLPHSDFTSTPPSLCSSHSGLHTDMQCFHLRISVLTIPSACTLFPRGNIVPSKALLKMHISLNPSLTALFKLAMTPLSLAVLFHLPCFIFLHRTCHFQTYYKVNLPICLLSILPGLNGNSLRPGVFICFALGCVPRT